MMKHSLLVFVALLAFLATANALTYECFSDLQCSPSVTGEFCQEDGTGSSCVNRTTSNYEPCVNITCSSSSDCVGFGKEYCDTRYGLCLADSQLGEPCALDNDCQTGDKCVLNVCSEAIDTCNNDADCSSGMTCIQNWCRTQTSLGGECYSDADCLGDLLCDDTYLVCVECQYNLGWDGGDVLGVDEYCDIEHYDSCDLNNLYLPYAGQNVVPSPTIEILGQDGDECHNDGCCATSNCVNGYCVGIGSEPSFPSEIDNFCANYGYGLDTNYVDGGSVPDAPNVTFFQDFFNNSNLSMLRAGGGNHAEVAYYRGTESGTGTLLMYAWFYDNTTGDVCYLRQYGTNLFERCIENCTTSGRANTYDPDEVVLDGDREIACQETDIAFASSFDNDVATGSANLFAIGGGVQTNSIELDAVNQYCFGGLCGSSITAKGATTSSYRIPDNGILQSSGSGMVASTRTWITPVANQFALGVYARNGLSDYLNIPVAETTTWDVECCTADVDCGTGYCCGSAGVCYYCGVGDDQAFLDVTPDSLKFQVAPVEICDGEVVNFVAEIVNINGTLISPSGTITANVSGGGSFVDDECDSIDSPCVFRYTAPVVDSNVSISFTYSGNNKYKASVRKFVFSVSDECHFLLIGVYDAETGVPLSNVKMVSGTGGIKYTDPTGVGEFFGLTLADINITFSKQYYLTETDTFFSYELDKDQIVDMQYTGYSSNLTNWALDPEYPTESSEVIGGVKNIIFAFIASPFVWLLYFIIFLIGIGVIKLMVESVI